MLDQRPTLRIVVSMAIGLAVGVLTSFGQTVLDDPWNSLSNAVSPWLTTAFVVGTLHTRTRTAIWAGVAATLLQVVGYYVTSDLRGYGGSTTYVTLWSICAIVGGPLFGAAGRSWRRAAPAGLGAALLVAAYASEAVVGFQLRLDYTANAVLFGAIALVLAIGLGAHRRQHAALVAWLAPALAAGAAGELALGLVT